MWTKDDAKKRAPNLTLLISHFNRTSYLVASLLVTVGETTARVSTLKRLIRLGEAFLELRNYDGVFAVYLGLNVAAVSRLKRTWKALNDKHCEVRATSLRLVASDALDRARFGSDCAHFAITSTTIAPTAPPSRRRWHQRCRS